MLYYKKMGIGLVILFVATFCVFYIKALAYNPQNQETQFIVVKEGDTLWQIAARYTREDQDIRHTVYMIRNLNQLEHAGLQPGQVLKVPGQRQP